MPPKPRYSQPTPKTTNLSRRTSSPATSSRSPLLQPSRQTKSSHNTPRSKSIGKMAAPDNDDAPENGAYTPPPVIDTVNHHNHTNGNRIINHQRRPMRILLLNTMMNPVHQDCLDRPKIRANSGRTLPSILSHLPPK